MFGKIKVYNSSSSPFTGPLDLIFLATKTCWKAKFLKVLKLNQAANICNQKAVGPLVYLTKYLHIIDVHETTTGFQLTQVLDGFCNPSICFDSSSYSTSTEGSQRTRT